MLETMIVVVLIIVLVSNVQGTDQFEVLRISNVPFPHSEDYAATIKGTYHKEITEFTVCHRFMIESYNDKTIIPFWAEYKNMGAEITYFADIFEDISNNLGWGTRGFQGGLHVFLHGVPEGGMKRKRFPFYHHFNMAKVFAISTWNHLCTSYSSKENKIHLFHHYRLKLD